MSDKPVDKSCDKKGDKKRGDARKRLPLIRDSFPPLGRSCGKGDITC